MVNGNLRVHPGDEEELKRLARSYKKRPVHPLIARPDGTMLDGTRRVLGLRLIGETEAEFLITDEELRPEDILEIQLVTAIHRAGLTGYEKWQGCVKLMQLHPQWQQVDLADFLHLTPASITYMLSPSKCLPVIQEALKAERITLTDCYTMSKVSDPEQHDMLAAKLNGAKPDELRRQARRARNGRTAKQRSRRRGCGSLCRGILALSSAAGNSGWPRSWTCSRKRSRKHGGQRSNLM
jgi:ParB-like chromosome segregation protein Spo0J